MRRSLATHGGAWWIGPAPNRPRSSPSAGRLRRPIVTLAGAIVTFLHALARIGVGRLRPLGSARAHPETRLISRPLHTACQVLVMGSVIITTACQDGSPTTGPSAPPDMPNLQQVPVSADPLLAHARAIPGFGGFFLDGNGRPTVYLKDAGQRVMAEAVLAGTLRQFGASSTQLQIRQADYDYLQLNDWFTRAVPEVLGVPCVLFADVDEGRIACASASRRATRIGECAGCCRDSRPEAAVLVEPLEPIHFAATLRDKVTPRRGGLHISAAGGTCTLGFNTRVSKPAEASASFITASHCTNVQGGVESTQFHQPFASNPIGREGPIRSTLLVSPALRVGGAASVTRRAARYFTAANSDLGGIARPTARSLADGPLTINAANPFFNIVSELVPIQGAEVNKVGRTTGWTRSRIGSTCIGINVANSNVTLFCQSRTIVELVPGLVRPGDSGSPVFYWDGRKQRQPDRHPVGGNASRTQFAFSPMSGIEGELGALKTF